MKHISNLITNNRVNFKDVINQHYQEDVTDRHSPKSAQNKRYRVNCSFTAQEYERLLDTAESYHSKPSTFLKQSALSYMDSKSIMPVGFTEKMQHLTQLSGSIANNFQRLIPFASGNETNENYLKTCKQKVFELEGQVELFTDQVSYSAFLENRTDQLISFLKLLANKLKNIVFEHLETGDELSISDFTQIEDIVKRLVKGIGNYINYQRSLKKEA